MDSDLGQVKYGKDDKLEADADKLLADSAEESGRSEDRDIEKMSYEAGLISVGDLKFYDPVRDWDTQDSAFAICVDPGDMVHIPSSICDGSDGNVRREYREQVERRELMQHLDCEDDWSSPPEDIPLLGANGATGGKVCTKCQLRKRLEYFSADPRNKKDGLHSWCRSCHREYLRLTYEKRKKRRSKN